MGMEPDFSSLIAELKSAKEQASERAAKSARRLSEIEGSVGVLETGLNEVYKRLGRPGADGGGYGGDHDLERKSAVMMCEDRRSWSMQKSEGGRWLDYQPSNDEIEEAIGAQLAFKALLRNNGDFRQLNHMEQKSLSAFSFGNNGWAMPPQVSSRILSCLVDATDFLSLLS